MMHGTMNVKSTSIALRPLLALSPLLHYIQQVTWSSFSVGGHGGSSLPDCTATATLMMDFFIPVETRSFFNNVD